MGGIKQGILGGFSGKVGNVVGSSWRGSAYIKTLPLSVRNPRTIRQLRQRSLMREVVLGLRQFTPILRLGYKNTGKISAWNAATVHHLRKHMQLYDPLPNNEYAYPEFDIEKEFDPTNGYIAYDIQITPGRDSQYSVSWDEPQVGSIFEFGQVAFLAYNKGNGKSVSFSVDADAGTASFSASSIADGTDSDVFLCYAFIYTSSEASQAVFLKVD